MKETISRALRRTRRLHTAHSLDRLRERYLHDATEADLWEIRDLAKAAHEAWLRRGRKPGVPGVVYRGWDCIETIVDWRGLRVKAVYVPRYDALRTILPLDRANA